MTIEEVTARLRQEARWAEIPVDRAVYERLNKDPSQPIFHAGSFQASLCVMGRDLGKDEVRLGQPLAGAGGKLVRQGILRAWEPGGLEELSKGGSLEGALRYVLLTNTVPFKPPGNKAYSESIKGRCRPFLVHILTQFWSGHHVITLGNEAFRWFEPYSCDEEFRELGSTDGRFTHAFRCRLPVLGAMPDRVGGKEVIVLPLPHPSPLNRRWRRQFPALLDRRLSEVSFELDTTKRAHGPDLE